MRKNTITLLIIGLVLMPLVLALEWPVCFDFQAPGAPTDLVASGNVELKWAASSDGPANCSSGVDYYVVYRDNSQIGTTSSTTYKDVTLSPGTYVYKITAVDKVGNGEGAAVTGSVTIARSSGGGGGGGGGSTSTSSADNWNCGNWSVCINGRQTQNCTHKTMSGVTKTNTQNCTVQIIQQTNQTTVQNQTQNQTGPKIIMINQTQNQTEPTQNHTGSNIIIINIPMRMAKEKEEVAGTIAAEKATKAQTTVPEQGNDQAIEQDNSPTGAVVGTGLSKIPWALIILIAGLTGAAIIFGIIMKRPAKEEKKEDWIEVKVPAESVNKIAVPRPPESAKEEKEGEWIEIKVPAKRVKKTAVHKPPKPVKKKTASKKLAGSKNKSFLKAPMKKLMPKKTLVKRKR